MFSWDLGNDNDSFIHHEGYYGVFGRMKGEGFEYDMFGVKISFQKRACVPCNRTGEFFWICIENDFPYILDEKRDLPTSHSKKNRKIWFCQQDYKYI